MFSGAPEFSDHPDHPDHLSHLEAFRVISLARAMADIYEANRSVCRYVHATSGGHESIQYAAACQLTAADCVSPYYRDDTMLLAAGFTPEELMLQLLAKEKDPFSGGRSYYSHPSSNDPSRPLIIHQSSATGMQAIPSTGVAQGLKYLRTQNLPHPRRDGVVLCSFGDNSVTEGEVSEAFQFSVLHSLPVIYLVQDNDWGISANTAESRTMNAFEYAAGFKGMHRLQVDGTDLTASWRVMREAFSYARSLKGPVLVHATVPLLSHHTSGVRKEFYRSQEDLDTHFKRDPLARLRHELLSFGHNAALINEVVSEARQLAQQAFDAAVRAADPAPDSVTRHVFAPTPVVAETGERQPAGVADKTIMVDAAMHAIAEIMEAHPESLFYGQDVGRRLGGVFREASGLAARFGDERVFNTAIQEAYIVGSTAGLSALGLKPIVEVQFADYIFPALNQLVGELAKSCYLTNGKFPVSMVLRVPTGAYGGGGPYHSGCVESLLLAIKGIKVCYPSNAADMKGLMKAAWRDPNPVVMLEHKGLYWSKVPGTEEARRIEPAQDYELPLGLGLEVLAASSSSEANGSTACIVTYGMGVYWALAAARRFAGRVSIIDLRTLFPLDEELIFSSVRTHGKCMVLTEEPVTNSFAESLAARITSACFRHLDAAPVVIGALDLPAVPINLALEAEMLPTVDKVSAALEALLSA